MRGNPALTFNLTRAGETRIERTIVPDAAMGATISFIPPRNEVGPAGEDAGLGERRPDAKRGRGRLENAAAGRHAAHGQEAGCS